MLPVKDRAGSLPKEGWFNGLGVVTSPGLLQFCAACGIFKGQFEGERGGMLKAPAGVQNRAWKEGQWKELVLGRGEMAVEDVKLSCDQGNNLTDLS